MTQNEVWKNNETIKTPSSTRLNDIEALNKLQMNQEMMQDSFT